MNKAAAAAAAASDSENVSTAVVLLELRDSGSASNPGSKPSSSGKVGSANESGEPIAWTILDVSKNTVDTGGNVQLEMYSYPVDLRKRKLEPTAVFLSVDLLITRTEANNIDFNKLEDEKEDALKISTPRLGAKAKKSAANLVAPVPGATAATAAAATAAVPPPAPAAGGGKADMAKKLVALSARFKAV
jgi:hypothetical protein